MRREIWPEQRCGNFGEHRFRRLRFPIAWRVSLAFGGVAWRVC
jgi:hypothetical protein